MAGSGSRGSFGQRHSSQVYDGGTEMEVRHGGDRRNPLVIDDEDDVDHDQLAEDHRNQRDRALRVIKNEAIARSVSIDLENVEEMAEEVLGHEIADVIDLTNHTEVPIPTRREPRAQQAPSRKQHIWEDGIILEPGTFVELKEDLPGKYNASFIKIAEIMDGGDGAVVLRGHAYTRAKCLRGMLACKLNEVCLLATVDDTDPRPWDRQNMTVDTPVSNVKRVRCLRRTNAPFPEHRFDPAELDKRGKAWVQEHGPLVCRYRFVEHRFGAANRITKPCEWAFARISEKEADERYRMADERILNQWRGGKIPGGSFVPNAPEAHVVDLESGLHCARGAVRLSPGQQYTVGDTFSGAGGASRGMEQAGHRLVFCVDNWPHAVESLNLNFPGTDIHQMDIHDFVQSQQTRYRVDMLHLSPPCQPYSPAHTVAGKDDDANMAALYSCPALLAKLRPRVFTLEETFGILHPGFTQYFNLLVKGFTDHGYSVRWKVCHLATYGLPQPRRRLIIIGAGPGETLPPFPKPTHGADGANGLKPLVTARQALAPLSNRQLGDHRLHRVTRVKNMRRWCPDRPLPRTITCSGGQNYHWSGKRDFTLQEYALLQGFPVWHRFGALAVKKQIGNAFPSSVVEIFYRHLATWLDDQDNVDGSTRIIRRPLSKRLGSSISSPPPPVLIEDSDSDVDEVTVIKVKRKRDANVVETPNKLKKRNNLRRCFSVDTGRLTFIIEDSEDEDQDPAYHSDGDTETLRGSLEPDSPASMGPRTPGQDERVGRFVDLTVETGNGSGKGKAKGAEEEENPWGL